MRPTLSCLCILVVLPWTLAGTQDISTSARCGPDFDLTCQGSHFGNCCSQYSYCGSTKAYCGTGCQNGFGSCNSSPSASSSTRPSISSTPTTSYARPSATLKVTPSDRCGTGFGFTCQGSKYGDCCSQYSFCGSTNAYCGQGCQQGFGKCNVISSSSTISRSSSTVSRSSSILFSSSQSSSSSSTVSSLPSSSSSVSTSSTSATTTPTPSSCTPANLFVNPSFEANFQYSDYSVVGSPGIQYSIEDEGGHTGTHYLESLFVSAQGTTPSYTIGQSFTISQASNYQASVWIQISNQAAAGSLIFSWVVDGFTFGTPATVVGNSGWTQYSAGPLPVTAGSHSVQLSVQAAATTSAAVDLDDFLFSVSCSTVLTPTA